MSTEERSTFQDTSCDPDETFSPKHAPETAPRRILALDRRHAKNQNARGTRMVWLWPKAASGIWHSHFQLSKRRSVCQRATTFPTGHFKLAAV